MAQRIGEGRPPAGAYGRNCVICGKPAQDGSAFCGRGCAARDLNNWLGDRYAIPTGDSPGEDGETGGFQRDSEGGGSLDTPPDSPYKRRILGPR
ncbi:MAG: hypothetical protein O2905_03060 [Proteobacteria bacterium]|nr:hypothetical protein [Pseudomonadota bacterium]MDA1132187.1 hypothetical protein [Pseudomonadota bacterium]